MLMRAVAHDPSKCVRFDDKIMRLSKGGARSDAKPRTLLLTARACVAAPEVVGQFGF
jgi:hypothetical protein